MISFWILRYNAIGDNISNSNLSNTKVWIKLFIVKLELYYRIIMKI